MGFSGESPSVFLNVAKVAEWLKDRGYSVSRSTVFNHVKTGKLKPDRDGSFAFNTVRRYAVRYLLRKEDAAARSDDKLQARRLLAQCRLSEEQVRLAELQRIHEEDGWITREDFSLEMAGRAAVLEAGLLFMVQTHAGDWIRLCGGNRQKIQDVINDANEAINDVLNEFASEKEFHVLFEMNDGGLQSGDPEL